MTRARRWMIGCLLGGLLIGGFASGGGHARAEDVLTKQRLLHAEHDFVDGRLGDVPRAVDGGTTPVEQLPVEIARHWWRRTPVTERLAPIEGDGTALALQRIAWARAGAYAPPYPMPAGGGAEESLPLLTALIQDRIHRETIGWHGLVNVPEDGGTSLTPDIGPESPLQRYLVATDGGRTPEEQDVLMFALAMQWRSYVGDEDPVEMAHLDKEADKAANQARVIYLGLLGSLLVSAFLSTLIVSRDRGRP